MDRTLESKGEVLYNTLEVDEPFDGQRNVTIRPNGRLDEERILYVRRADYAFISAEVSVGWLPAALPAPRECYTLGRLPDGTVSAVVSPQGPTGRCRLSTSSGVCSVSLW